MTASAPPAATPGGGSPPGVLRLAAFADAPGGGNPAGVVIDAQLPAPAHMQRVACEVGYSETAFLAPIGPRAWRVRYFSPAAEVPFCGHATIAAGVALAQRDGEGTFALHTNGGVVAVTTSLAGAEPSATLTSLATKLRAEHPTLVDEALALLGWEREELHERLGPAVAFAGAWHLVLVVREHRRLQALDYDFQALRELMLAHELTTLQLVWPESEDRFHVRDPFPVGNVVEDPATGAAAAAFGGYLRELHGRQAPSHLTLLQGADMGRPSRLEVELHPGESGVRVSGNARAIEADPPVR